MLTLERSGMSDTSALDLFQKVVAELQDLYMIVGPPDGVPHGRRKQADPRALDRRELHAAQPDDLRPRAQVLQALRRGCCEGRARAFRR